MLFAGLAVMWPAVATAQALPAPNPAPNAPLASPTPAAAVSDPCTTTLAVVTRPSVTTSVCTVKRGHVLIETGYANTTPDGGPPLAQYPQTLVRAGTAIPNLEVSVAPPTLDRSAGTIGSSDVSVGAKYELGYSAKWLYGVNAVVSAPTGLNGYSAGGAGYTANANASYAVTPGFALAGTLGYNSLSDGSHRYTSIVPSLVLSAAATAATSVFFEAAAFSHALGPLSSTRVQYLTGVEVSFANRLQVDLEAGRSATVATGRYRYTGVGLSYYF